MPTTESCAKQLAIANGAKAFRGNANDNTQNVLQIAKLRYDRANCWVIKPTRILWKNAWRKHPKKSSRSSMICSSRHKPAAEYEFAQLTSFAQKLDGIEKLENGTARIIRRNSNSSCSTSMMKNSSLIFN
jgi:peptidyl-dipeptidase Dcp